MHSPVETCWHGPTVSSSHAVQKTSVVVADDNVTDVAVVVVVVVVDIGGSPRTQSHISGRHDLVLWT